MAVGELTWCHYFFPVSAFVVDRAGRRVLLFLSGTFMAISMSTLGAFFYMFREAGDPIDPVLRNQLGWLPLASLVVFMVGYSIGYASVPFLLLGELLPARVKNICSAIASSFNLVSDIIYKIRKSSLLKAL